MKLDEKTYWDCFKEEEQQEYTVDINIDLFLHWATPPKNTTEQIYRAQKKVVFKRALDVIAGRLAKVMNMSELDKELGLIVNSMLEFKDAGLDCSYIRAFRQLADRQ